MIHLLILHAYYYQFPICFLYLLVWIGYYRTFRWCRVPHFLLVHRPWYHFWPIHHHLAQDCYRCVRILENDIPLDSGSHCTGQKFRYLRNCFFCDLWLSVEILTGSLVCCLRQRLEYLKILSLHNDSPLLEHWNGSIWHFKLISSPNIALCSLAKWHEARSVVAYSLSTFLISRLGCTWRTRSW